MNQHTLKPQLDNSKPRTHSTNSTRSSSQLNSPLTIYHYNTLRILSNSGEFHRPGCAFHTFSIPKHIDTFPPETLLAIPHSTIADSFASLSMQNPPNIIISKTDESQESKMMRAPPSPSVHNSFNFFNPQSETFDPSYYTGYYEPKTDHSKRQRTTLAQQPFYSTASYQPALSAFDFSQMQTGLPVNPPYSHHPTPDSTPLNVSRRTTPTLNSPVTSSMADWGTMYPTASDSHSYSAYTTAPVSDGSRMLKLDTHNNYLTPYQQPRGTSAMAMAQAKINGQPSGLDEEDVLPQLSVSSRHSDNGLYSPLTPTTSPNPEFCDTSMSEISRAYVDEWMDEYLRLPADVPVIKSEPTDKYNNNMYSPAAIQQSPRNAQNKIPTSQPLQDIYQVAQTNHQMMGQQNTNTNMARNTSPFRACSPYHPHRNQPVSPARHTVKPWVQVGYASAQREQRTEEEARAIQQQAEQIVTTPKTVSPRETFLEFSDQLQGGNMYGTQEGSAHADSYNDDFHPADSETHFYDAPLQSNFDFQLQYHQYPDHSGAMQPQQSMQQQEDNGNLSKPTIPKGSSGPYACNVGTCTQRFSSAAKLAKHKKDVHKAPSSHGMTSGHIPRSHQPGPHKCTRVNPTTGKPCNTIFSRPYDLTRHEDTIHNTNREKARCELCNDDKTFSRADALTRHKKVKHGIEK